MYLLVFLTYKTYQYIIAQTRVVLNVLYTLFQ
nr:MAG TPA: hypothetical protein [Caudoviricetes sp.]